MKRMSVLAAAAFMAASIGAPGVLMAQAKEPATTPHATPQMEQKPRVQPLGHSIEGRVKSVNLLHTKLTLEDGTKLTIPKSLKPAKEALKKGAMVAAEYEEKDGKKVVTSIHLKRMKQS
jgi:Cu/Ag efflux protein CusF